MTIAQWKVAIEDLGLPAPKPTDPPDGRDGEWFDAQTRFARRGFARLLVQPDDELSWVIEAAHPALTEEVAQELVDALGRASDREWSFEQTAENHLRVAGSSEHDDARVVLVPLLLFADAVTADRADLGDLEERLGAVERAATDATPDDSQEATPPAPADEEPDNQEKSGDSEKESEDAPTDSDSGSPFETIGDEPATSDRAIFEFEVADEHIELGMGLPDRLDLDTFESAIAAWGRSLRGRYDVRTEPISPDADRMLALPGAATRVMLRVEPDALEGSLTVQDIAPQIREHIETLEKVSDGGIDPLVFLGVRARSQRPDGAATDGSSSKSSEFEPIGGDSAEPESAAAAPTLLVADDEEEGGGMVLDLSGPPVEGAPLKRGNFTDPRLDGVDATTPLVDVVLRHPGYSDRNIGQVLSILLSIDYSDALALADSAPRVIAWGVGNERAQTMKTVIEGAGGRVQLVEPDTFAPR